MVLTRGLKLKPLGGPLCCMSSCDVNTRSWNEDTILHNFVILLFLRYLVLHTSAYSRKPSSVRTKFSNKSCPVQNRNFIVIITYVFLNYCTTLNSWFRASWVNVNKKIQLDATIRRHLFTAK
jgi:hypothetical protein